MSPVAFQFVLLRFSSQKLVVIVMKKKMALTLKVLRVIQLAINLTISLRKLECIVKEQELITWSVQLSY